MTEPGPLVELKLEGKKSDTGSGFVGFIEGGVNNDGNELPVPHSEWLPLDKLRSGKIGL